MAEEVEKCDVNNIPFWKNTPGVKEEFEDDKVHVCETAIVIGNVELQDPINYHKAEEYELPVALDNIKTQLSLSKLHNNAINDDVKIEREIKPDDIKVEFHNGLLYCELCHAHYEDYCIECGMLVHILNRSALNNTDNRAIEEIPNDILEIRDSFGQPGIYALKVIPKGVKFGPFTGLSGIGCPWKMKGGKLVSDEGKSKYLNWMRYINPARNISEQNLFAFHYEENLYYQSTHIIPEGQELLVYFGAEYEGSLNNDVKMDFLPITEQIITEVFACTLCCFGFSSRTYLTKHKTVCLKDVDGRCSVGELVQCPFCKVYLDQNEYSEYHMAYCCERSVRKCNSPVLETPNVEVKTRKAWRRKMYECKQCRYNTPYKADLNNHSSQHYGANTYKCGICSSRFKRKASLRVHLQNVHIKPEGTETDKQSTRDRSKANRKTGCSKIPLRSQNVIKCALCEFSTNSKHNLNRHARRMHLKDDEFCYKCVRCEYKINSKHHLKIHMKSKHLQEFDFKCESCSYKTNFMGNLKIHIKRRHLKEFKYKCESCLYKTHFKSGLEKHIKIKHSKALDVKCESCDWKTNVKTHLKNHIKSKHLKEFDYKCESCEFKTNVNAHLKIHMKTKHLREFSYICDTCQYQTNNKADLRRHTKSKHLEQFDHKCDCCGYKTNRKSHFEIHMKTLHLKEFDYKCATCDYKTNRKSQFVRHITTSHSQEYNYKCEVCVFKAKTKWQVDIHVKSKHLEEFDHQCASCSYKTNVKSHLENHTKAKHLKEFHNKCESCDFKTNYKQTLEMHVKTKHLREFNHKCESCDYKTNHGQSLKMHIKSVHLKEFNYNCAACKFKTNKKGALERHRNARHL